MKIRSPNNLNHDFVPLNRKENLGTNGVHESLWISLD